MTARASGGYAVRLVAVAAALAMLAGCAEPELILPGERLDLRADAAQADASAPISLPAAVRTGDWTHRAGNARHAAPHAAFAAAPRLVFSVPAGQGNDRRHKISADPVVSDGRVFTIDSMARVTAHGTNGAPLWSRDLTRPGDAGDASGGGLAVADGTLFVGTDFGDLVALDAATGRERWRQELDAAASGAPTVAGDLVYVAARDELGWAVRTSDGRVAWTLDGTPSPAGVIGGAAPATDGRIVVFPFSSGEVTGALRAGGTEIWSADVMGGRRGRAYAGVTDISGDPVIVGDRIYVGSASGRIVALDAFDGRTLWTATEGAVSPVVVAGGSVFAVSDRAELVRLDASDGRRIWGTPLPFFESPRATRRKGVFAHYGPVLAGGRLWVASSDGVLRGFEPAGGTLTATVALPGGAASNPVVAGGTMYLMTADGRLAALR